MKTTLKKLLMLAAVPIILYGCAAPPLPDLYWPSPPDAPRIKYVRDYRGSENLDFKKSSMAAEILLGAEASSALKKPNGIYTDDKGRVYVTDTAAADIFIIDPAKKTATTLSEMGGSKSLYKPIGVTVDYQGRIFVTDSQEDKVAMYEENGKFISNLTPDVPFKQPTGIISDNINKKLYITDTHTHDIRVFDLETLKPIRTIGKRGKEEGQFNFPSNITVDPKGRVFVVDTMNGRVQIFDAEGKFIRAFGQFGDAAGMFARPKGIAVDSEGHIYVVDSAFNNVQIFDDEGQILLAFAGYGNDRGQLILPSGAAIDKDDFIYVVDSWNRRVEVFEFLGDKHKARSAATAAPAPAKK